MALPRTQTEACQQFVWILRPKVGAGQNVPEFCKAGIRLNKIMGEIVMEQKRSQKCITQNPYPVMRLLKPLASFLPNPSTASSFLTP